MLNSEHRVADDNDDNTLYAGSVRKLLWILIFFKNTVVYTQFFLKLKIAILILCF
jgi:hypothetical protein